MNILVLGTGAQGSTVVQKMNAHPNVDKIICADYDQNAVNNLTSKFNKTIGFQVNAKNIDEIINLKTKAGIEIDLLVNALPLHFAKNALEAALKLKCNYQDFAAGEGIKDDWIDGVKYMLNHYHKEFKKINKLAIIGTGSAPGLICLATRILANEFDKINTIYNFVYEGVKAKRFLPFWFSPQVALWDMAEDAMAFVNGKIIKTKAFSLPIYRKYEELPREMKFVEHSHDEPVYYGLNSKKLYKGCKNAYFKYGGLGIDFAEPLSNMGMLNKQPITFNNQQIIPYNLVLSMLPPAPKYENEIKAILDEGLEYETGCIVVEIEGIKNKLNIKKELHIYAPSLEESFKREKISSEQYITGQAGATYTQLFVENKYNNKTGLITCDDLEMESIKYYFEIMNKLDITYKIL